MQESSSSSEGPTRVSFPYETDLVAAMLEELAAGMDLWGVVDFRLEFDYRSGRTDIIAVSSEGGVIAIEAKLRDWREALQQAYRNTSFATESYILMPPAAAERAVAHSSEFDRRGVGICALGEDGLRILHPARRLDDPLLPGLQKQAVAFASSSGR